MVGSHSSCGMVVVREGRRGRGGRGGGGGRKWVGCHFVAVVNPRSNQSGPMDLGINLVLSILQE